MRVTGGRHHYARPRGKAELAILAEMQEHGYAVVEQGRKCGRDKGGSNRGVYGRQKFKAAQQLIAHGWARLLRDTGKVYLNDAAANAHRANWMQIMYLLPTPVESRMDPEYKKNRKHDLKWKLRQQRTCGNDIWRVNIEKRIAFLRSVLDAETIAEAERLSLLTPEEERRERPSKPRILPSPKEDMTYDWDAANRDAWEYEEQGA